MFFCQVMMFHQTFSSYPCIHRDKILFSTTKLIYCFYLIKYLLKSNLQFFVTVYAQSSIDIYSRQDLYFIYFLLWHPLDKLLIRLDNELDINLKLSINFNLYKIVLPLPSFTISTEHVIYFSVFSNNHSNSFVHSLIIKWLSYVETLWITTGIFFSICMIVICRNIVKYYGNFLWYLYLKLQSLWAAPLYFPL